MKKLVFFLGLCFGASVGCVTVEYSHKDEKFVVTDKKANELVQKEAISAIMRTTQYIEMESYWIGFFANFGSENILKAKTISNGVGFIGLLSFLIHDLEYAKIIMQKEHIVNEFFWSSQYNTTINATITGHCTSEILKSSIINSPFGYSAQAMKYYLQGAVVGYCSQAVLSTTFNAACAWWKLKK